MYDNNARRRAVNRIRNGGLERRGRKNRSGQDMKYTGLLTDEQWEFCQGIEAYKKKHNRRFLSSSEILAAIIEMGYKLDA